MTKMNVMSVLRTAWGGVKKTLFAVVSAACAMMMAGCFSPLEQVQGEDDVEGGNGKMFTFHVKGAFDVGYEEMSEADASDTGARTRAAVRLEDDNTAGITDVWALDYVSDKLVQVVHQVAGDEGFGHPQMVMAMGSHEVKLVASKGDGAVLSAVAGSESTSLAPHRLEWTKVKDTFVLDYPVEVTASSNGNRAPELKRAVSGVKVVIMDKIPEGASVLCVTMKRCQMLTLPGLENGEESMQTVALDIPQSWKGQTGRNATVYTLCTGADIVTDVRIVVKDESEGVMADVTVEDVTLKRNRQTVLKGCVFGSSEGFALRMDNSWEDDAVVEF